MLSKREVINGILYICWREILVFSARVVDFESGSLFLMLVDDFVDP